MGGLVGPVRRLADGLSGQVERFGSPARVPRGHGERDHRGDHQLTALGARLGQDGPGQLIGLLIAAQPQPRPQQGDGRLVTQAAV